MIGQPERGRADGADGGLGCPSTSNHHSSTRVETRYSTRSARTARAARGPARGQPPKHLCLWRVVPLTNTMSESIHQWDNRANGRSDGEAGSNGSQDGHVVDLIHRLTEGKFTTDREASEGSHGQASTSPVVLTPPAAPLPLACCPPWPCAAGLSCGRVLGLCR